MNASLARLLDHLAATLTAEREAAIDDLHRRALAWESVERLPLVLTYPCPDAPFPPYPHREALDDPEKMLFNELVSAFGASIVHRDQVGDDLPCTVRTNFGTGIVASLFGAHLEFHGNDPPWVRPFATRADFAAALERDPLDFRQGWCPRVMERYECYRALLAPYPALGRIIRQVLPDLQGPLDTVELLRGSELYLDFHTDPGLVQHALTVVATAQIGLARHLAPRLTDTVPGWTHQHGFALRGNILLRADSTILLSPVMYRDQVKPHDERVLRELGDGGFHACGNFMHLAGEYLGTGHCQCLDLGQPHLNDLDRLYELVRERQVALLRLSVSEEELTSGSVLRRFPTGASLVHAAPSLTDARRIMTAYRRACV